MLPFELYYIYIYYQRSVESDVCDRVMWYADVFHLCRQTQHTRRSLAGRKMRSQFSISTLAIIFIRPISKLISFAASRQGPHTMARFEAGMRFEADAAATLKESGELKGSIREFKYYINISYVHSMRDLHERKSTNESLILKWAPLLEYSF